MAQQDDNIKKLYDELQSTYDVGSEDDFRNYLNNAEHRKALYNELKNDYDIQDEKAFDDYLGYINGEKAPGTTKVGSVAQQVVNEYDQSAKDNAEAEEDLSAATSGAKIGGNISLTPVKANNQQTAQPAVDNTAKSVMDANGRPIEQAKATGPKTQFVPADPNYVQATPTAEALKKYPWMQPDQVYLWNTTTKEPVVSYFDENGQAVTDEDLQIKKAKSEITGQEDTEYMHPEAAALQLPNGNTRGVRLKKGALTQMADEIMRKEYGDNYLNTQFGRDGNVYTGAERRDLGAQQLYDELNSDVRKARISFAVADDKYRNEILSRIKAKWGKVADETSLVNAVNDENAAKQDIDIVAQQNINDLNAEIQNISRQMDQRGAEIDNASSPFVDQTFNARDVDAKYRLLQSKLNYAQNALKSWENVKNSGSLDALAGFKDAVMDISAWDFGFSDLKNSIALLTAKGNDKQELVNLYGRYAEAAKFEDKYNPDSYRYGKIAGTSMPYALQFAGTGGGFKSIGSAVSKKATSIAEKYALEGLKKQVVKGLGVVAGDIARAYTMSGTIQGLNTISDILNRSAGELTVDKQGNYQLKSDEPLLKSIYKGVTASAIENYTEMLGERLNIGGNLMRMLPKIGLGRVSNAITKIGTQDWYRVCNNWLSRAGVNDFGGEVLEEEIGIILNAALVGDNPLFNGSGGLLDVRTQKDILGGMLYSISAMRAGALAMYGVKKGVGSAFIKTLDMYDKMQLNQSDKGGQSIFGEDWAAIKDEIDNTPNEKVNAVIEKLAKEHPSKDEQSAIIDYAVKLLKTRGHNLGIAMASDGENDEGAQEEVQDMPDLSQPNAEYFNKDDGMIHKASLYPDASDPTGTAKDVFIIKGNLVTNEDGSINKDASDDTIIYIDGNGERHIASPDKFAAAYPPMSNDEVRQANEGVAGEGTQTTDTFNKGDEVNINVNGIIYTATIQGTDGSGNYNVYYEDENGMMHPAKFTADQLNEMNGKSTVSNGQQATSEQPADVQQQVEQPVVEQSAQQEQETQLAQQAQEEQKPAIPKDEKGNTLYHQVPVETTIKDLYDGKLDDNEIRDFVDVNISEADKNLEKVNKKAPKIGTNKDEYLKKKQEWQKQVEDATRIRDYWNSVKDYIAQQTHTTPEEVKAAQDEISGEAARREYQDMGGSVQQDAVSVASDFIRGAKITPESFKAETGYGAEEQRKFVGMIAKAENGGKSIDRLAEELVSYDNAEMNGSLFGGDTSSAKDAILSALQGAGTRGELKQTNEAEEQAYVDARNAARDAQYMEQYGMTYEEYLAYEEQIMPTIWREYNNYDETAFNNMYAEEIEQLLKSKENDTTGEKQADDRGNQVLSEQQVTEQRGSTGSQEQRTEAPVGVQGTVEDGVVPERTSEDRQEDGSVPDRTEEVESATEGLTSEDADNLLSAMEARAEVAPDIELTPTNWVEQFGEDGMVDTPIGKVKMGENQIAKLFTKGRSSQFGMIRPTLTNPDVIVEVPSSTDSANDVERPTSLLFIKAFLKNDGSKVYYFKSVTVKKDGLEVSVSSHLDRKKRVEDALRKGKLQYRFDGGAQTEHRPANVSVTTPLAGQGASNKGNATIGDQSVSDMENGTLASPQLVSSESKDSDKSAFAQTIDEKIAKAEEETDVNPTEGQKEAGNYKKGHVRIDGYDITIEQPKGSVRRGTDADGKQWEQTMNNTYGYIRGTEGVDGDHIDIFLSDNPTKGNVYVVDQVNPDGSFDEHKVMYGFNSADEARNAYLSNYEEGWQGLGTITEISKDEFKKWVNSSHRKTKPFAEYKSVKEDNNNIRFRETNNEVSVFALKHNLNEKDVEDYADYIRRGNLNGASRAFKEIRRKVRLDNQGASLGQFAKIFSPIEKELYERFGNIDELRQQYVQRTLDERNAMEAARKKAEEEAEAERRRLQEFQNMSSEQLDAEYMKAVEANDESRMRDLVNEAARRNGYGDTGSEYQGVGAWSAPSNPGYESDEERRAAVENDAPDVNITDIANGYSQQPSDYFTNLRAYGTDTAHGRESAEAINKAIDEVRNGKDPMVKVYRAVPKSVKEGKLRNGDWVTPSRKYAEMHGDNRLEGDYRIIEQEVPASQLWWDGNDINEWGFDDGKGYAYRNTKNNRKLNDLITRDDKGNIIPLSQRFNARKADVRYRNTENQAATDNIEDVNKQFNQQLEGLTEENADKVTLSLGRPSAVLRAAGVEDKPMKLYGNKVIKKMRKHGFTLAEIKDLPRAVADPIAVFNNYQKNGNRSILTELQIGDKHILVSVTVGKTGVDADFNIVSSVFGKGSNNVVDWINKGYATFINKEKALDYLHFSERSISEASDNQELVSTANIIRNFENPNVLEENLVPTEQTNDIDTAVADTANKLNIGVRVAHSVDEVSDEGVRRAIEQGRRIQGFYDTRTGEIVVYAPNAVDAEDAVRTVLHEGVAHYGLRQLVGEENFNTFLDNIYNNVSDEIKSKVDDIARKNKLSTQVATEEYLAGLAEKTNFEEVKNSGIWDKIKDFFMDLLTKAGIRLNNALSDNELRYILWRSYDNLQNPTRDVINTVRDITKQRDLNVGNYAVQNSSGKVAENNNDEINRIVEEAKANGTYMKAPNGSDTNLNERQWAQVRTKAFKDWFGDWENDPENASKVVDENGEPKVVYHGTNNDFTVFDWSKIGSGNDKGLRGKGIYLSPNIKTSQSYGNNVITAFVNIKKPFRTSDFTSKEEISDKLGISEFSFDFDTSGNLRVYSASAGLFTDALKEAGYDGIIYPQRQEVIVYSPNQIKSATDNTSAFSSDDDDIRYRFIGETGARNLDAAEEATTRLDNLSTARQMEQAYNDKKARIDKLRDSKPVEITGEEYKGKYDLNRDSAQDFILKNLRGEYTIADTGEKVTISKVGAKKVTSHSMGNNAHLKSIVAIPQLLENAIFIEETPNEKSNGKYDSYRYYVVGLKIGNEDYTARITIGVKNGEYYYDHYLTEIEKGNLIEIANGFIPTGDAPVPSYTKSKDTRLISLLQTNDQENARKIKLATGWERGADGKWKYETPDFEYHPNGDARQNDKYKESDWYKELYDLEERLFNGETLTDGETERFDELSARVNEIRDNDKNTEHVYLDDYVKDDELFKAYPELKQTKIDFVDLPNEEYSAKYNEEENRITVNQAKSIDDKSAIAHEVQHAIQHIEGFAQGSNVDNYNSVPTSENVINDIIDATDGHILDGGGFDNTPEGIFNALNRKTTYGTILRDYSSELDDIANKYGYETIFDLVNDIDKFKSRVEMYLSEAGEVEARNVEARINMTPEQRRQSLASETEDVAREDQLFIYDNLGVNARQGTGALTDSELSNANDPAGKMLGKPSRTPAQQKAFAERERQRMADRAREVADILHLDNVEIVTDASTLQGRRAKAKGFYSRDNGKIVIVVPNHVDMADIEQTVLHEAVAHYGLRKLFGSNFDTFLYNVYNNADMDVREKISQLAAQHNWNFATATEEYLASLAEKTNFENLNASWWDKIKSLFLKLLHSIGLKGFTGVSLSDNELRYILWRSYENLKNPGRYRSIIDEAKDITMQNELRVGNYSAGNSEAVGKAAENGVVNIEDVNRRFNEELGRLTEENAQSVILNLGRPGNFLLASGLSDRPIKLYGNKLLKKMRKHGFTTSDVKNLPKEINNPIAVFKGSVENSFAILTELEINGNNVLASIYVGKGNDIDFNIISSVYGKNGNSVVSWINDGKILYVNKEKALNYLRISAPIAEAQDNQELSSAANIVKNFENPNISEENMRYGNGALAASESNGINKTNETNGQEAEEANRRFNEELNAFKAKTHKGLLHLGQPGRILNACGINEELTLSPTVLSRKLKQHGLNVDDIKGLAGAIQEPILVYQHGDAHPNMVIVTDLAAKGGKVSVAVELDGEGNVVELNNVSSVHSKDATTELERLSNMRDGYLEQALRWVDKNEVSDWLGIADLNSPIHANNPKLVSIANILQNFENPSVGEENILYREAKKVEKKINSDWRDEYDKKLSTLWFKLTEAAQDAMRSVKILQDIIAKETSAPISDDENVYWRENRLSSVNKYEQEYYAENYFKPIVTEIANLVKYGARYNDKGKDIINSDNDILKYLIAKHGIERNNYFREREAMNARKPYEDQIKELQKQVEKEEIKEEDANKKIAKLQEQADKAEMKKRVDVLHKDYSGLTELFQDKKDFDTLATSYVSDFEKKFDTKSLWNAINRATKETLRKAFVDGLISRESYENTAKMYKYYIPLRGWANDVASEKYNYIGGKGHSSKILEISHGRTSLADNPISKIGQMMQDAILQGNRNRMKQAVYNLAMNHDTSLLNIKRQWYQNMGTKDNPIWERVFPDLNSEMTAEQVAEEVEDFESRMRELKKEGKATQNRKGLILRLHTTKREETQHRISVAINGKEYNIFVNGNPRAAQAINGELNDVDRYGSYISKINRFLSQVYTSVNPEFVVTNYQRDAGFAASIVASTEPLSYQKEWAKNMTKYNPITTGEYLRRLIKKAKTGNINPNNKAERYMQEFLSNGGETGFTNILNIDDYKKLIRREIKSINSVVSMPKAARAAVAFTERVNTVFEDATRYATYVTSREQGRTIDRSIRDAKEISLNFNTRGADGLPGDSFIYRFFRGLRRWMIFVNPSIQGLNKAGMAFRNHPLRSSMMIAGLPTLLGYALPAIMQAVVGGGDGDDDDKNVVESYKDLPKWVRRTNIAIPIGGNNFVTIPLSYELRVSYGLGEMMWEYGEGMIDGKEMAAETLLQLSDLLPVSLFNGTLAQSISPTIARPFVDIIQNRNFYGKKIYNDSQFIEGYPEYMKAYAGTPKWLVKSTEVLNNVRPKFGADVSDKYTPGLIDLNPAMIDYLLSSYLGGLYNFPSKFGKTISMIWDEDMRDIQNVPIVSRNWKNSQSGNPYNSGDRYKTYMKEYDLSKQRFNGYKKEVEHDVPEFLKSLNDLLDTPSGKRMLMIDAYKRDGLDKLNRRIRDIDTYGNEKYEGEKDALTKIRDGLKEELINKLDSISDGTLDFVNGEWTRK